ncbi:PH domain-containing protein [Salinigranum halophilum]|jgi:putative membrane protein|uniref:PH domain-containing protein n=1 Tax=Salinigranum halophilum TaxID=2565931 RepID=UPI00115E5AFB|nr:PH domain-containing protein [Salinigranum halophilum]
MKLSPLSVPYRVLERGGSLLVAAAFIVFSGGSMLDGLAGPLTLFALLGVGVLLLVGYEVAYYQRYEYELTADTFDIHSGVFARRDREIPLRRIQNVDISRNVVQRVLGLAAVDFETAGGSETEASLRFVSFEEAKRLQREVPRLKRSTAGEEPEEPEPATELFALSDRELALVGLLSFDFRVPGVLALVLSGSVPVVSSVLPSRGALPVAAFVLLLVVGVFLFSWIAGAVAAVVNYYDFHLVRAGDELQYERGLLQRYDGSIPFDKLQTLTVEDTPLKRAFGYATLLIETAGYAPGQSSGGGRGSEAAIPLAERDRVFELANAIDAFGDPELTRPPKRVRRRYVVRYLLVVGTLVAVLFGVDAALAGVAGLGPLPFPWYLPLVFVLVIPPAAHLKWTHRGYWLGEHHVVTRNGVLKRQTKVVPYDRIQTVIDTRTVFQRRWNLATVTVDTAGSLSITGGDAAAVDVDDAVADDLRAELDERLREALAERRRTRQSRRARADALGGTATGATERDSSDGQESDDTSAGFVWGESLDGGSSDSEQGPESGDEGKGEDDAGVTGGDGDDAEPTPGPDTEGPNRDHT